VARGHGYIYVYAYTYIFIYVYRRRQNALQRLNASPGHERAVCWGCIQGYLAHEKTPTPQDQHRALGIVLLQGPRRGVFLMSEVPQYTASGRVGREIGNLLPNNRRQRRTCYALCHILYPVSAAHTSIFRMDSNSTSYI